MEGNTTRTLECFHEKDLLQNPQQIQTLQTALQDMQASTQQNLEILREDMEKQLGEQRHSKQAFISLKAKAGLQTNDTAS